MVTHRVCITCFDKHTEIDYYTVCLQLRSSTKIFAVTITRRYIEAMRNKNHPVAAVSLFFESTKIRVVEKVERYTIETLISNVGGALGLWAGISIITMYQAIVYLLTAFVEFVAEQWFIKKEINKKKNNEGLMPEKYADIDVVAD